MPVVNVIEAGISSIQGLGQYGAQRMGISPGGAMDRFALAQANALTKLPAGAAAIEVGPLPMRLSVSGGKIRCAICGSERDILVNEHPMKIGTTFLAQENEVLTIRGARGGQFSYLSFEGGILGGERASPATHDRSWVLKSGESLLVGAAEADSVERQLRVQSPSSAPIRVVLGPQLDQFKAEEVNRFLGTQWAISYAANRMGYLLEGGRVQPVNRSNLISDGTVTGNIQITGSGQPIVIMCDRGTVGGYPKIATVISADLARFAQTPVGGRVLFEPVSVLEAQAVARTYAERLANQKTLVQPLHRVASVDALWETNVAGEAFDAAAWTANDRWISGEEVFS